MNNETPTLPRYTPDDIERIARERLTYTFHTPALKIGTICECVFTFPNGNKHAWVEFGFPMHESNHDDKIGKEVALNKAKNKLWEIAGQYTLATGEKL